MAPSARGTFHEDLCPAGEQRLSAKSGGDECRGGSEQQNSPTTKRKPHQDRQPDQNAKEPHRSALRQQHIDVGTGSPAEIVGVGIEEFTRGVAAFVAQHRHEFPFAIELR